MLTKKQIRNFRNNPKQVVINKFNKYILRSTKNNKPTHLKKEIIDSYQSERVYSVVSAVYNVEKYIDDFIESIVCQTLSFERNIELILVNDGSTDNTAALLDKWQKKYSKNIIILNKANAGQASARNLGLDHACGEYITFIDPDDFVSRNYFAEIDNAINSTRGQCAYYSTNLIPYLEDRNQYINNHPLKFKYDKGNHKYDVNSRFSVQLSASTAFFCANIIKSNKLYFSEKIKPNFEDAHFVNKYVFLSQKSSVFHVAKAEYYYRKRSDNSSTLNKSWTSKQFFKDVLIHGCLDLFTLKKDGKTPVYIQRAVLYHLIWYVKKILNNSEILDRILLEHEKEEFVYLFRQILQLIDDDIIKHFELAGITHKLRIGFYKLKSSYPDFSHIGYIESYRHNILTVSYFTEELYPELFYNKDKLILPKDCKTIINKFNKDIFVYERRLTFLLNEEDSFKMVINNIPSRISAIKQYSEIKIIDLYKIFSVDKNIKKIKFGENLLELRRKYSDCWILMDRRDKAGDNAEALYYYLKEHTNEKIYFAIEENSKDAKRLGKSGFNLINFDSNEYYIALEHAKFLISSHMDKFITDPYQNFVKYADNIKHKFICLQHGVTKDDLSTWLNTKHIDLLITAARKEFDSFTSGDYSYKLMPSNIVLTGFPRHDLLQNEIGTCKNSTIIIMPTWRNGINNLNDKEFTESEFYLNWNNFINSTELFNFSIREKLDIKFIPHQNFQKYTHLFNFPEYIQVDMESTYKELFLQAKLLVTDYSSVAFEMGQLKKNVIYFQFDKDTIYSGNHTYAKGYYNYQKDGFGPVIENIEEAKSVFDLDSFKWATNNNFFAYYDNQNCRRVYEAIKAIEKTESLTINFNYLDEVILKSLETSSAFNMIVTICESNEEIKEKYIDAYNNAVSNLEALKVVEDEPLLELVVGS